MTARWNFTEVGTYTPSFGIAEVKPLKFVEVRGFLLRRPSGSRKIRLNFSLSFSSAKWVDSIHFHILARSMLMERTNQFHARAMSENLQNNSRWNLRYRKMRTVTRYIKNSIGSFIILLWKDTTYSRTPTPLRGGESCWFGPDTMQVKICIFRWKGARYGNKRYLYKYELRAKILCVRTNIC